MHERPIIWLLDNGHGGIIDGEYVTAGKRSPEWGDGSQLFEGELTRALVSRLMYYCKHTPGMYYYNIVPELEDAWNTTRANRANSVLRYTLEHQIDAQLIYLSIHGNAGGGTGWEIWTSIGQTLSDKIADRFYKEAMAEFPDFIMRPDTTDGDFDKESMFTVIANTIMPAVLTESFFYDTYDPDCKLLMSEDGRDRIALAHFKAMLKWGNMSLDNIPDISNLWRADHDPITERTNFEPLLSLNV